MVKAIKQTHKAVEEEDIAIEEWATQVETIESKWVELIILLHQTCISQATLISTIMVIVVTQTTSSSTAARTMGDTMDPTTTISMEAAVWVVTKTITLTMVIRDLVDVPIDTTMVVEIIVEQVVKEAATITKWIVIMELEDMVMLVEVAEMMMSIASV